MLTIFAPLLGLMAFFWLLKLIVPNWIKRFGK
jgi:hypothetical protein